MSGAMDRPDVFVLIRILESLENAEGGVLRTPLAQAAGLNYTVFTRYLARMTSAGLVETLVEDDVHELVRITTRGTEALGFLREGIRRILGIDGRP